MRLYLTLFVAWMVPLAFGGTIHTPGMNIREGELIVGLRAKSASQSDSGARSTTALMAESAILSADEFSTSQATSLRTLNRQMGLREGRRIFSPGQNLWLLRFDTPTRANAEALAELYADDPNVLFAEPNQIGSLSFTPTDPLHSQTADDMALVGMEAAWDVQEGADSGVTVAVIDSGVDASHPDLSTAIDLGTSFNFVESNTNIFDDLGHGTRVAGIIGATENNGEGIAGVAFGSTIMSLDVTNASGEITVADVIAAINWAATNDADVINMSLRFSAHSQALATACDNAAATGALLVAAAGNENQGDQAVFPASYFSVLGVGAVADDGTTRAVFSNYNGFEDSLVELVAPGVTVFSTTPSAEYNGSFGSGTSFAAPWVSGVAALVQSHDPTQSALAIRNHLRETAASVPGGQPTQSWAGFGLLNAQDALETPMLPDVSIAEITVDDGPTFDGDNDGDGVLDEGETARLIIELETSAADAINVVGTLSTADPAIGAIASAEATFGDVRHLSPTGNTAIPFAEIVVSDNAGVKDVEFSLALTGDGGFSETLNFNLQTESAFTVNPGNYFTLQTWTADNTYEVHGVQNFNSGLTVEPGTTVKLDSEATLNINAGSLTAIGTTEEAIFFTSLNPMTISAPTGDIGARAFFQTADQPSEHWGQLVIKAGAVNSRMENCRVEFGGGVLNQSSSSQFASCEFYANTGWGLVSTDGSINITDCIAVQNAAGGIHADGPAIVRCHAFQNNGIGLMGDVISNSSADSNESDGINGDYANNCEARNNGGTGLDIKERVNNCVAENNGLYGIRGWSTDSVANYNGSWGIVGWTFGCTVIGNEGGGVVGRSYDSRILHNGGYGALNAATLDGCDIIGNSGPAATVLPYPISDVINCRIANNGGGVSGPGDVISTYIGHNEGTGLSVGRGGSVISTTLIGNSGGGMSGQGGITQSHILFNGGTGVHNPYHGISHSTIAGNSDWGVYNLTWQPAMNFCNIYQNGEYDYYDDENTASGFQWKDIRNNYWGAETTAQMVSNPFPSISIDAIYDEFDSFLPNGWYANYGASGEFAVEPVPNAPDFSPPACLIDVTPKMDNPINVGEAAFTLIFSEPMDTAINPAVTFGTVAPYSQSVVEPEPGWVTPLLWQGTFDVVSGTGHVVQTLRVAGATASDEFVIPDDTSHQFVIDTEGGLSANNGLASVVGKRALQVTWTEDGRPITALGYNVFRSTVGLPGTYQQINPTVVTEATYLDSGLELNTVYFYIIELVEEGGTTVQWTPPFAGSTADAPGDPPIIDEMADQIIHDALPHTAAQPGLNQDSDPVEWSLVAGHPSMEIDSVTGVVTWPEPQIAGSPHTVTIQASNDEGADVESWDITVLSLTEEIIHEILGMGSPLEGLDIDGNTHVDSADLVKAINGDL